MDISSSLLTLLSASLGAAFTFWGQRKLLEQKISLELQAKEVQLEYERQKCTAEKLEMKIEEAHILASELGREFSLTFLNIDWEANISVSEYDIKYRAMCDKCSKLQMIVDLNVPSLSAKVEKISDGMNLHWGSFRNVLAQTHKGKSPSELGLVFDSAVKYSREVPELAYNLRDELSRFYRDTI